MHANEHPISVGIRSDSAFDCTCYGVTTLVCTTWQPNDGNDEYVGSQDLHPEASLSCEKQISSTYSASDLTMQPQQSQTAN